MAGVRGKAAERPRVLLIAPPSSYRISAYHQAAADLGIDLVVASEGEHSLIPEVAGGIHVDLEFPEAALETIVAQAEREAFQAVVATDDATVELASRVAGRLGLSHNPPSAVRAARRKDLAREALAEAGLPVPPFRRIDLGAPLQPQLGGLEYPQVVKPLALSASRGVIRADNAAELIGACRRIAPLLATLSDAQERRFVLVEEFIPGAEYALEGMLQDGVLQILAVFDKPDPLMGPFFEETYYLTPSRLDPGCQDALARTVTDACRAYGLRQGPVHAEVRMASGKFWVLEIAARTIGGDCARLLSFGTGQGLEHLVLRQAIGEPVRASPSRGAAGVLMIPVPGAGVLRRVEGVMAARKVAGIQDLVIAVREGYELVPLPEGGSYLGFVFALGESPEAVERALRKAHSCLNFVLAPVWHIAPAAPQRGHPLGGQYR
jgi:biotin carboxylase